VSLDAKGFVETGASAPNQDAGAGGSAAGALSLQSSAPGVFAVGEVRSGSVKRVCGAIGEGAAVVAQLHVHLDGARSTGRKTSGGSARAASAASRNGRRQA
jgi:thioredoxin reductase (NADPH)